MKNNDNKGVVILLVFIIIVLLIISILFATGTISLKINDNENNEIDNSGTNINTEINTKKDTYQVLELAPVGGHAVVYNGEVYVNIYDSTSNIDMIYGEGKYQTLIKTRNNYKEYNFGELTVNTANYDNTGGNTKWQKLNISNVKSIYNNIYGQAPSSFNSKYGVLMLNEDDTVSYIGLNDLINGNSNPTKLNTSNISSILNVIAGNSGYTTYLVNSNGTKIDVNTLIK